MLDSLRRLFLFFPLLLLGAVSLFVVLSWSFRDALPSSAILWNSAPHSAETIALDTLAQFERGEAEANKKLLELGGAALPFILPRLASLPIDTQRSLAQTLWPLAERMRLTQTEETLTSLAGSRADEQLVFWQRFAEEYLHEFRPLPVERLVVRLAERNLQLRKSDLYLVDTYALPALVAQLGRVQTQEDLERVRRLIPLISHMNQEGLQFPAPRSLEEAQDQVTLIRGVWDREGAKWTPLSRLELLLAHLTQTEFALWTKRSYRQIVRLDRSEVRERWASSSRISVPLFLSTLGGALFLGPVFAGSFLRQRLRSPRKRLFPVPSPLLLGSLAFFALLFFFPFPPRLLLLSLLSSGCGALLSIAWLEQRFFSRIDWRTHSVLTKRSYGARLRALLHWTVPSLAALAPVATLLTALFVTYLELKTELPGLALETRTAWQHADIDWLMFVTLSFVVFLALLQWLTRLVTVPGQPRRSEL